MLKRIELKNFMSHEHTVIEPAAGLTVITGPNNVGKSAVISALQILCYNENSTYVMRHGEKECSVTVETDDGHTIKWQRKQSPSYEIDGQKFDRLSRNGVPEELKSTLRLTKVEADTGDAFDVHFGSQKNPIFLLDQTGATAARFFASSSDASRLVAMQKKHNDKWSKAKQLRKQLDLQSQKLSEELAALEPMVDIEHGVEELENEYQQLIELDQQIFQLGQLLEELRAQHRAVLIDTAEVTSLKSLTSPPKLQSVEPLVDSIQSLSKWQIEKHVATDQLHAVSLLQSPPILTDTTPLSDLVGHIQKLNAQTNLLGQQHSIFVELNSPPAIEAEEQLESLLDSLTSTQHAVTREQVQKNSLVNLKSPPILVDADSLQELLVHIQQHSIQADYLAKSHSLLESLLPLQTQATDSLAEFIIAMKRILTERESISLYLTGLNAVCSPPLLEDTSEGIRLRDEIFESEQQVAEQKIELEEIEEERTSLALQIREAAESQTCPVCDGPLSAERLIQRAERGGV